MIDMSTTEDAPLGYLLHRVMTALRPEMAAVLSPLGLTLPEFVCMRMLSMNPGLSSAELSRLGNVSPQAMNTVLHRLENARVVARPASVLVWVTVIIVNLCVKGRRRPERAWTKYITLADRTQHAGHTTS